MLNRIVPANFREAAGQPRGILAGGAVLVVLALLANSAGLAIFIAALVVPTAVLNDLGRRDLSEVEPWWAPVSMGVAGAVAGIFITLLNILALKQFEDETDPFNQCCGVFLGRVDLDVRHPGALSFVAVGLILPIVAEILKAAGPLYLRQQPRFNNEVMDGVTLGAAAGGGYAAAAAILYFWPLVDGSTHPGGSASGWTSALIALLIVRPLIFCATTGLICAGIWHHAVRPRPDTLLIPVGSALVGAVALAIGTLVLADQPAVVELIWNVAVMVALLAACRYELTLALGQDRQRVGPERQVLPAAANRVICPTCGKPTRPGLFCANCGSPLSPPTTTPVPEPVVAAESSPHDETAPIGVPSASSPEPPPDASPDRQ
ncbi:MAG TPA: zinc ribbon domain-containing protein [Thermomicrobiales bacterium]|jgi:RsiW-degrading membrane proteinase PrsW (M82 family)